jgi:membrane-associated phospholipid phosphatase
MSNFAIAPIWSVITRFGELQILAPAMVAMTTWLALTGTKGFALRWFGFTALAALLTTMTKVAFIGWGLGYAPLDFTGISGHAMLAAAILPVIACCLASSVPQRKVALMIGFAAALVVAVSRVTTGAHSVSETASAFALGAGASLLTLAPPAPANAVRSPRILIAGLGLWLAAAPVGAPQDNTHGIVTRLSLELSHHSKPYTRREMRMEYRQQQGRL